MVAQSTHMLQNTSGAAAARHPRPITKNLGSEFTSLLPSCVILATHQHTPATSAIVWIQ